MFNRKIQITEENLEILFANGLIENLRYAIISLDAMFNHKDLDAFYGDRHTFYFFHMQSVLAAQGNIWNVLFNKKTKKRELSENRILKLREVFKVDMNCYPLVGNKDFRNTNEHFDERYYKHTLVVGDFNIIDKNTPIKVKQEILNTPHLRTIDIEKWEYITYDQIGKQISLDLKKLRKEMYDLLSKLCAYDIRIKEIDCWEN